MVGASGLTGTNVDEMSLFRAVSTPAASTIRVTRFTAA